ncbi:FMRFamide-related peptides-like [Zerene cesonia]|uniref:FMRFamide-related peptides-like n=1 Tax=Zerene cesonia TaxID=33412 RepID=UPI0018E4FE49|nr:FMRFamide-related peptides-like [Zerene cesonia]
MKSMKHIAAGVLLCLMAGVVANPVRRSPDLEARRRSAIDRSMIRFGRSYPPEPSAADIRESLQRPSRRGNSFLRFGRSQPLTFTTDDLITLLRSYEDDYEPVKRSSNFIRLGRDPKFIRLGRSTEEDKPGYEQSSELFVSGYPQRKNRARDHFIRLGRDSEEVADVEEEMEKRSVDACHNCEA